MSVEMLPVRGQKMETDGRTIEIDRGQDTDFPPWSLWMISLFVLSYTPICSVLGTIVGHLVGLVTRFINDLFSIVVDLYYVIFIAAMLGSIIPFLLFIFIAHVLLNKNGYTWQTVWISYDLNLKNFFVSCIIGIVLALVAFSIVIKFFSKQNIIIDLGIGYWGNLIFSLANYIFIAVVFEEIFCRGIFYQALRKKFSIIISVLISALFFTVNHLFYNSNIVNLAIIFVFGIVVSILLEKTKSLHCCLILHFTYNTTLSYLWI